MDAGSDRLGTAIDGSRWALTKLGTKSAPSYFRVVEGVGGMFLGSHK